MLSLAVVLLAVQELSQGQLIGISPMITSMKSPWVGCGVPGGGGVVLLAVNLFKI